MRRRGGLEGTLEDYEGRLVAFEAEHARLVETFGTAKQGGTDPAFPSLADFHGRLIEWSGEGRPLIGLTEHAVADGLISAQEGKAALDRVTKMLKRTLHLVRETTLMIGVARRTGTLETGTKSVH